MYYFIVNPNSRSGAGKQIWERVESELKNQKISYECHMTEFMGHAREYAASLSSLGTPDTPVNMIVVGGDGTISEVLTGITCFEHVLLGVIPTGSGNDFCRGMKLHTDPRKALDCILHSKHIVQLDVPHIESGAYSGNFGISAGIGFDAAVCHETNTSLVKRMFNRIKLGKLGYVFIALKQIAFMKPGPMKILLDDNRTIQYSRVYFSAVLNQKYEGGGFKFCPDAKPDDNMLDLIVVEGLSKFKILCCLPTAFWGFHVHFRGVHVMQCKSARIRTAIPTAVHKDGEFCGKQTEILISLQKKTLKIIAPVI